MKFFGKLSSRLFSPLIIIFAIVIVILVLYVPNVTRTLAVESAIESATSTVQQYKAIRGYYTQNIIKKILTGSEFKPHYEHKANADQIPLPATFIHDISKEFSNKGIVTIKLYSPYPFPNRNNRKMDSFGTKAWSALNKAPKSTFSDLETINGKEIVRVALADTMVAKGCVDCHNSHPDTPKVGWSLNDVRGVLEVQVPIDKQLSNSAQLNYTIASIVIIALLATVTLLFTMFRKLISTRLRQVNFALNEIADGEGDLSKRLDDSANDEIGAIASSFNRFVQQLAKSLKRINQQVSQLTESTGTMEAITKQAQNDNQVQNEITETVAHSMEHMMNSAQEMSDIALSTAESSKIAKQESNKGNLIVEENLQAVSEITQMMLKVSDVVSSLEADSQNIGSVIDVIRGIADQTNLLALNAAIEAARAGEQGRGFAVVADEVRTLASKTQESTEEINRMIEQLQAGAKNAVNAIEQSKSCIDSSQSKASETNEMIESVGTVIEDIQSRNDQLANAAELQTATNNKINCNIEQIKDVSDKTKISTDELLTLAQEINSAVNQINGQLQKFIR